MNKLTEISVHLMTWACELNPSWSLLASTKHSVRQSKKMQYEHECFTYQSTKSSLLFSWQAMRDGVCWCCVWYFRSRAQSSRFSDKVGMVSSISLFHVGYTVSIQEWANPRFKNTVSGDTGRNVCSVVLISLGLMNVKCQTSLIRYNYVTWKCHKP